MSGRRLKFGLFKISLLLALIWIPANPDDAKHSSAWFSYTQKSRFLIFYILKKNGSNVFWIGSEHIYAQFHCLDLDLWLAYFKICLGGLGSCGRTINNFHVHFGHHGQGNYAFERKFVYYFGICVLLELATTTFICTHCCSKINYENEYIKIKN